MPANRKFLFCFLFFFWLYGIPSHGLTIDTTIAGDGSPGPYSLNRHFIDTASLVIQYRDTTRGSIPPYVFLEDVNSILFSQPLDSGVMISVHFTTAFLGLQKTYSLYERRFIERGDTADTALPMLSRMPSSYANDNIAVSGYKSLGVTFGNQGQLNMAQALEVRIFGKINPETELSANLSDQGTSLEGDTREIGEIDRMYVALENPLYSVVAGDQYIAIPPGSLLEGYKKIKGLSAAYTGKHVQTRLYGAISGGKYTTQTLGGRLGFQGPYYLTGNNEADLITPVSGTVAISINGQQLTEGETHDYVVDYSTGSVRFMPSFPIDDNSIILVSYEYKAFDYQRTFAAADAGFQTVDSTVVTRGVVWLETDSKEHPIDLELTKEVVNVLAQSGDAVPMLPNGRDIHPNDVSSQDALYRLYKRDTLAMSVYYRYSPYNSNTPADNNGYFHVWFNQVPEGTGDYIQFSETIDPAILAGIEPAQLLLLNRTLNVNDPRGPVYYYVGSGNGNYTARSPASAPQRTVKGELATTVRPREWLTASVDIAAEEKDKNLFSSLDDQDNTTAAARSSFLIGTKYFEQQSVWLGGNHRFAGNTFSREILSSFERRTVWDREHSPVLGQKVNVWQVFTGITPVPLLSTELSYGQYFNADTLMTHRFGYRAWLSPWDHLALTYAGRSIGHFMHQPADRMRGDSLQCKIDYDLLSCGLRLDDEWYTRTDARNGGKVGSGISLRFKPISLSESFYYAQDRRGGTDIFLPLQNASMDTGSLVLWQQELRHSPRTGWTIAGSSTYQRQEKHAANSASQKQSVLLVSASNDIASVKTGISTNQLYRLSSEKASAYVQVPVYIGEGRGTHRFNDSLHEYVPDRRGDYIIEEREVFNSAGNENIRKSTLQGTWHFKPTSPKIKGILRDLSWQGSFMLDEHIRLDSALVARGVLPLNTWIPGYSSLSGKNDSLISYADIFYRQDIDWRPKNIHGLHSNLFARPFLRQVRSYTERGIEWGARLDQTLEKWFFSADGRRHTLSREGTSSYHTTAITDHYLSLEQRYYLISSLSAFGHESIGRASKDTVSGPYYRLQPGLTLRLPGKGWAEFSYTWSQVNLKGATEYPMAQGFSKGTSHVIDFIIDINAGEHFTIGGSYRGDLNRTLSREWLHVVSMEVKAFL